MMNDFVPFLCNVYNLHQQKGFCSFKAFNNQMGSFYGLVKSLKLTCHSTDDGLSN